jgi:ABC-type Zn uptake system ZnuABC Zn-binding protein ZnuA
MEVAMVGRGRGPRGWKPAAAGLLLAFWSLAARSAGEAPLRVTVTGPDIEAIVKEVGGDEVETLVLFTGCILRKDLRIEPSALPGLLVADAVVWTGHLNEASAIWTAVASSHGAEVRDSWCPRWIDVSRGARQPDAPVSSCQGYGDLLATRGDPYFWLDPENGAVIARNIADGLGALRPSSSARFAAVAKAFGEALQEDIARWKRELEPLSQLKVFSTRCGWQNFARIGGLQFVVCEKVPGCVLPPEILVKHAKEEGVTVVILDTHTPEACAMAFREARGWTVVEIPSSIGEIPGAHAYAGLFDNMVQALQRAAKSAGDR